MEKDFSKTLPFKSKLEMLKDVATLIEALHRGKNIKEEAAFLDLKTRALFLDEEIQQAVLIFIEQIAFQQVYDPEHLITKEVEKSADQLIEKMGFFLK